jgi:hypothetical protein
MQTPRKTWCAVLALTLAVVWALPAGAAPAPALPGNKPGKFDTAKWLIPDAEMVAAFNVRAMLDSALVKKGGLSEIKDLIKKHEQVANLLKAANVDPLKDIDTILASSTFSSAKDVKMLIVVRGTYNVDKAIAAAQAYSKKKPDDVKVTKEGTTQVIQFKAGKSPMFAAFADRSTILITPTKAATVAAVKTAGKKAVNVHKDIITALKKLTGKESMAMAMTVNDELKKALGKAPQAAEVASKIDSLYGTLVLSDAATLAFVIGTSEAKAATKLEGLLEQGQQILGFAVLNSEELAPFGDILSAIKIKADKSNVKVDLKITKAMIAKAKGKDK